MGFVFGLDFSKWYLHRAAPGVWHICPPAHQAHHGCIKQFDSGAQALAAFNRGYK